MTMAKRTTICIDRLFHDFQLCQHFGYPCRFTVGRNTGYGPSVVAALEKRGYTLVKVRKSCFEITGVQGGPDKTS
jgi:hypothetical protein